jgi:hypothetical protein
MMMSSHVLSITCVDTRDVLHNTGVNVSRVVVIDRPELRASFTSRLSLLIDQVCLRNGGVSIVAILQMTML